MTAYNTALLEAKKEGLSLSINQKQVLYAEIQAQTMLTTLLEQKTQLFDGIASSISGAFTSIVTGTASAKQAFANMAISILNQISQMIVQMMVMRMLMAAFGMGAPVPTTAMNDPGMVSQMNYGAVSATSPDMAEYFQKVRKRKDTQPEESQEAQLQDIQQLFTEQKQ